MASQTLRPHRSPSPAPAPPPINPTNPAKLTRQSLGPPSSNSNAKGFAGLGITSPTFGAHPRHVSSSVALGGGAGGHGAGRDSLSPHPAVGTGGNRTVSGGPTVGAGPRPSSEFLPGGLRGEARTPEAEQIDQWFKHLASWEQTLEEMAAASTDQNFTEELGAIEQWFRVLSEAERTAALYSLLQHSTPVQIRFFLSVLHHMAQSDPMAALLSPNPANMSMESKLAGLNLKSPSAGGGAGFPGSPTVGQFLAPESALDSISGANKANINSNKNRQNRISAPGTLQPSDRWQSSLDQVTERGPSPGADSNASNRSKSPDLRPKSTDYSGLKGDGKSARVASGGHPALAHPQPESAASPVLSPFLNGSWASMTNTPLVPMFTDPKVDGMASALNMANMQLNQNRVAFEDARKYRRSGVPPSGQTSRNVSAQYNDDGEMVQSRAQQPGRASPMNQQGAWSARSPVLDQFGLGGLGLGGIGSDPNTMAALGLGSLGNPNAAQMLALAQAQVQAQAQNLSPVPGGNGFPNMRGLPRGPPGRRSPMLGKSHSPNPDKQGTGGGAGGGAGVAGPEDVDMRILEDIPGWLRVLRLHKYTPNFEKSNWKDMVAMTDSDLQDKGVSAQGARTKFLKVFYNVREKEGMSHPPGQEEYAPGAAKENKQ